MLYDPFDWFGFSQTLGFKRTDNKIQAAVFTANELSAASHVSLLVVPDFPSFLIPPSDTIFHLIMTTL